jgi:four helix bundle protein
MEVSMVQSFRELRVWQKSMDLADAIYTASAEFPRTETFGLSAQIRRAAVSVPSNIAEGRAIGGGRFLYHIRVALGSEAEIQTQLELAMRRGYVGVAQGRTLQEQASEVGRMLHSMHSALKARRARNRTAGIMVLMLLGCSFSVFS